MMSTKCSKHVEKWNKKYIEKKCVRLVNNKNYTEIQVNETKFYRLICEERKV